MEERTARTLATLHEALDVAYGARNSALEHGDRERARGEEARIARLEERITQLEGTGQRWAGGSIRRATRLP